jgi:hypothetical protein
MKVAVFEGTPGEIAEALQALGWKSDEGQVAVSVAPSNKGTIDSESVPMPRVFAQRVLKRIPLAPTQKTLMKEVLKSGSSGIFGKDLLAKLNYSQAQFRGMMGAFGRRVANTAGFSEDFDSFFSWEWHEAESTYRYWFEGEVEEAVRATLKAPKVGAKS